MDLESTNVFGTLLRLFRQRDDMTYRKLAELCECDYAYLYRLEMGEKRDPSREMVERIGKALNLSPNEHNCLKFCAWHRF